MATSWATIQETPNQKLSKIAFTAGGTITINAPASKVFGIITDHKSYSKWNTWMPKLEFGDATDAAREGGEWKVGDRATMHVEMANQGKAYDVSVKILECTSRHSNNDTYIVSWQGLMLPSWFGLAERVQTVKASADGTSCEVKSWESMSGWGVYVLDFILGVKKQLAASNAQYLEDLKKFSEL